ncbi:MAG: THUMP domain-containing protein [Myxococcota bacterium]
MAVLELTTDPGLEDLALGELRARVPHLGGELRPDGLAGHLRVWSDGLRVSDALALRSIHRIVRPILRFALPPDEPLAAIRRAVADAAPTIPELDPDDVSFRVRCKRVGAHPFTSEDVERIAGAGVRDARVRRVRLVDPDVVLRCDVRGSDVRLGVQLERGLSRRSPGPFRPETSLRANVAWALLELARPADGPPPLRLLDPFAGGGTVVVEAAARWPAVRLAASDLHLRCADGVRDNLAHAGAADRSEVRVGDARALAELWAGERFDTIVTNPPFGHRLGKGLDLEALYRGFLRAADAIATDDARLVVLAARRGAFNRALRVVDGWETRHVRVIELGGLYAGVFVLARPPTARTEA